jgi:hypothetical protein
MESKHSSSDAGGKPASHTPGPCGAPGGSANLEPSPALIAAAPDMYAALQVALDRLELARAWLKADTHDAEAAIRAALAKAEGR